MRLPDSVTGIGAQRGSVYVMVFLTQLGTGVAIPILPELRETFGVSVAAVSLTTALWGLARLVFDLPLGVVIERVPTGRMLLLGCVLLGTGAITSALAPTFEILLVGRLVSGAGAAVQTITATLALLGMSTKANRGRVLGIYQASLQAGASLSPVVAGFASQFFGWQAAFLVAGIGAFGALVVVLGTRRSVRAAKEAGSAAAAAAEEVPEHHEPRRSPAWLDLALVNYATFVLFFMTGGLMTNVVPLFGDTLGLDAAGLGLVLSIATGLRFAVSVVGSFASDHYGRHGVMLLGFVLSFLAILAYPLVGEVLAFTIVTWLLAIGRLGNGVPIAMLSDRVDPARFGRWISMNRFIADFALLVSPVILGLVIDHFGFAQAFYLSAAVVASVIVLMLVEARLHRHPRPAAA